MTREDFTRIRAAVESGEPLSPDDTRTLYALLLFARGVRHMSPATCRRCGVPYSRGEGMAPRCHVGPAPLCGSERKEGT